MNKILQVESEREVMIMTNYEALEILNTIPTIGEQVDALEMAIEALEQKAVLDSKKAENESNSMTNGEKFTKENNVYKVMKNGTCVWIFFTKNEYESNTHYSLPLDWWETEIRGE